MENLEISQVFKQMADLLEIQDANPFRVRAYRNAARVVAEYPRPLRKMVAEESDLTALPSVGKEMARHIEELVATGDLEIIWVMADNQINQKSIRFIDGLGLRDRVRFAVDPGSRAIDQLGIRRVPAEEMETGVPHPTTVLIDREGRIRFVDVRRDFQLWIDPDYLKVQLAKLGA